MLAAADPEFQKRYPFGVMIYDALGRKLHDITACNPVTGEVVIADIRPPLLNRVIRLFRKRPILGGWGWNFIHRRHGFWPAPLTVVPIAPEG